MVVLYVSREGNDGWSGTRPEPSQSDGPLATLARAQQVVRRLISKGLEDSVTVLLRGGIYPLSQTMVFDARDTAPDGLTITYRSYPGEQPCITSGEPITGWERHTDTIYRARLARGWQFHTFSENGMRARVARYPKLSYERSLGPVSKGDKSGFRFDASRFPPVSSPERLQFYGFGGGERGVFNWFTDTVDVKSYQSDEGTIHLEQPVHYEMGPGSRFYLQNALEFLSDPGEFFFDPDTGTLYYIPYRLPIEEQVIIAPRLEELFRFEGESPDKPVKNVVLRGLELRDTDAPSRLGNGWHTASVLLTKAEYVTIDGCSIHNIGLSGVLFSDHASHNRLENSHIYDTGFMGAQSGYGPGFVAEDNTISNCHIHDVGQLIGHGACIHIQDSGYNTVTHNRLHHAPRYGISIWAVPRWGTGDEVKRTDYTGMLDELGARFNYVGYNDVFAVNLDTQDTGPIEAFGTGYGNVIDTNAVHDTSIPFSFGFGVYLDDGVQNFTVKNNLVYRLQQDAALTGGCHDSIFTKGCHNVFYNNVAVDNRCDAAFGSMAYNGVACEDLRVCRNIFHTNGPYCHFHHDWTDNRFAECDHNLYVSAEATGYRNKLRGKESQSFEDWQAQGYDTHSLLGVDPCFFDREKGDFRLRYDSPAFALGFEEIDAASIGLTADYPFADPDDQIETVSIRGNGSWANIRLSRGETIPLSLLARTAGGTVADLTHARTVWETGDREIAEVFGNGRVLGKKPGITHLTVTVTRGGVERSGLVHVLVGP